MEACDSFILNCKLSLWRKDVCVCSQAAVCHKNTLAWWCWSDSQSVRAPPNVAVVAGSFSSDVCGL